MVTFSKVRATFVVYQFTTQNKVAHETSMKKELFFRKKIHLIVFLLLLLQVPKSIGNAVQHYKSVILVSILVLFKCPRLGRRRFFHSSIPTLLYLGVIQQLLPICVPCVSKFASLVKRNFPKD